MPKPKQHKKLRKERWNDCNVIHALPDLKRLWHFGVSEKKLTQKARSNHPGVEPIPPQQIEQIWRQFLQKRLNIALLPADKVFLRVVHLPKGEDADEMRQMLEFQLEKLSPLPVAQIVWSFEFLPCPDPTQATILLILSERSEIELLLEDLESVGYQTDRIELPVLHPLTQQISKENHVRIELQERNQDHFDCLVSWHIEGWIRHVGLVKLPNSKEGATLLVDNLNNTAWTGELEGWMGEAPAVEIAHDQTMPESWLHPLKNWTPQSVSSHPSVNEDDRARTSAERATRHESRANLMPDEIRTKYRQQYIDGMWMSSLIGMVGLYIFGVLIYFAALEWRRGENIQLQTNMRSKANVYTNTMKLQAKVNILQEQVDLKYSALDCLKTISEMMPDGMSLVSFNFRQGKLLTLRGSVPTSQTIKVTDYHEALIEAEIGERTLFAKVSDPSITSTSRKPRGNAETMSTWSFNCELKRSGFE